MYFGVCTHSCTCAVDHTCMSVLHVHAHALYVSITYTCTRTVCQYYMYMYSRQHIHINILRPAICVYMYVHVRSTVGVCENMVHACMCMCTVDCMCSICVDNTSDLSSSPMFTDRTIAVLFLWQVAHRSDIGLQTTT